MKSSRSFFLILFFIALTNISFHAQNTGKKIINYDNEILLLNSIVEDAKKLILPENRAVVYAEVGKKFCYFDKNRASQLFQKSFEEIVKFQKVNVLNSDNKKNYQILKSEYVQRNQILTNIAYCDGEIALDYLIKSRSKYLQTNNSQNAENNENSTAIYQEYEKNEKELENRFKNIIAEQNPNLRAEHIRSNLRETITVNTLYLIKSISVSDPQIAQQFADEAGRKLLEINSLDMFRQIQTFEYYLNFFGKMTKTENSESFTVSENLISKIADKLSQFWLESNYKPNDRSNAYKIVEEMFPERLSQLKENQAKIRTLENQIRVMTATQADQKQVIKTNEFNDFIESDPSFEELISQVANFPNYKRPLYIKAAEKLAYEGKVTEAVNLLRSNFSQEEFPKQFGVLFQRFTERETSKGNYTRALSLIDLVTPDSEQVRALNQFARYINHNKPESADQLIPQILSRIRGLTPKSPKTVSEMETLLMVVEVYSYFETPTSFQILSNIIPTLDEVAKATAVTNQFLEKGNIKKGEHLFSQYDQIRGFFGLIESLKGLKNRDLQGTLQFIDKFGRLEDRIFLKLRITEMQLK